ncbi:acetyl-CoA decarbonylase/synthase complex subunit gamma [Candidatus Oleimmundimicrobium sp.]|uniref:acetyl-CoA decarbonylase/synthase complex subunit gamma n=1 Tax=Candidatus Oleimmundimicrobium sp. TaxID=3060597 RepID=UPI002721A35B|nr:acetyl-CoA decarbonylase/synthase complex subunit gamma [Candidatus Oleimmundimicrobium sp.]MDO8886261.1 acetyl-CoA decarbonylase/synthase complex subunit gamma [Candidatus Oleimmundimicrobium sp.]
MALTGLDIYKKLPQKNCGECGIPTCLAFAMKLAVGQTQLDACPYVSEETKTELSEASAPPIRLITVGTGDKALKIGEEAVLFRHEKTFYHQPGLAILVDDGMDEAVIDEKLAQLKSSQFERVGQFLRADLVAVKSSSNDSAKFVTLVKKAMGTEFPLVLISENSEIMKAALSVCVQTKPLLYAANENNFEQMAALAKESNCPLVVAAKDLGALSDLVEKVTAKGVKDIILDPGSRTIKDSLKDAVFIRRAALKKKFKPLGYPIITFPCEMYDDPYMEAVAAGVGIMKYAGVIVVSDLESWKALPLYVLRQNIYTDPQKPMQIDEGIYPIGEPDENSPVLLTTNFSLTYFTVSGEVEASKVSSWICIMDVEGLSVLTAWAAGKFIPENIGPFMKRCGITDKVKHRKIVIPGYVAQISGELEEELPDWEIQVGPREAGDIPSYLKNWSA